MKVHEIGVAFAALGAATSLSACGASSASAGLPNVVGLTETSALKVLAASGYRVYDLRFVDDRRVAPRGTVIGETPSPGSAGSSAPRLTLTIVGIPRMAPTIKH